MCSCSGFQVGVVHVHVLLEGNGGGCRVATADITMHGDDLYRNRYIMLFILPTMLFPSSQKTAYYG